MVVPVQAALEKNIAQNKIKRLAFSKRTPVFSLLHSVRFPNIILIGATILLIGAEHNARNRYNRKR